MSSFDVETRYLENASPASRVDTDNSSVEVKTNNANNDPNKILYSNVKAGTNILNSYRSYTYIFTLAALNKESIRNPPASYKENENYFVIARSGGKKSAGLQNAIKRTAPTEFIGDSLTDAQRRHNEALKAELALQGISLESVNQSISNLLDSFNKNSPGQFNFYINNVVIESIVGGSNKTSLSPATNIEFTITEPYSSNGFIEALQVSSIAAGNDSYVNGAFLLMMEFIGYRDGDELSEPEIIPNSSRYFPFIFHQVDISVDESGSHYNCKGVPYNERALGETNVLHDDVGITGQTVEEILKSLEEALNNSAKKEAEALNGTDKYHNEYEIRIPTRDDTGKFDLNSVNKDIAGAVVTHLLKNAAVYQFADPETIQNANKEEYVNYRYDPSHTMVSFAKGHDVLDCIVSVIRDSEFLPNIIKDSNNNSTEVVDANGFVDYFMVYVETEELDYYDEKGRKPFFKFRYMVVPYKIHYSRIQPNNAFSVDTTKVRSLINRNYYYLYTGKNTDIKSFQLNLNNLYYQALPLLLGNKITLPFNNMSVEGDNPAIVNLTKNSDIDTSKTFLPPPPIKATVNASGTQVNGQPNAKQPSIDPYYEIARAVHQGILANVDQVTANIEIIGDPYFLVTDNMGNQRHELNGDGTVGDGEAPYALGDVHIYIELQSPFDINPQTGEEDFQEITSSSDGKINVTHVSRYSGVFRVITLTSSFKDGEFTQVLDLVRMPGQLEVDTSEQTKDAPSNALKSIPDPTRQNTPTPTQKPPSIRSSANDLAQSIVNGSPITGLPNELSNIVPGAEGSLAGSQPSGNTLDITQVAPAFDGSGALTNRVSGLPATSLNSVVSAVRLANAGLLDLTGNINYQVGGAVHHLSSVAQSLGVQAANAQRVARLMTALGAKKPAQLLSSVISKIGNLESKAAGLISNVSSKIYQLNGKVGALERELGMISNTVSGLGGALENKLLSKVQGLINSIPHEVDINSAIRKGILLKNIVSSNYSKLPPMQPEETAPPPEISMADVQNNIDRASDLSNLKNEVTMPDILGSLPPDAMYASQDMSVFSDKLSTIQAGMNDMIGATPSVESNLNNINKITNNVVPNTGDVSQSVVTQYGSNSETDVSPLTALMKSRYI